MFLIKNVMADLIPDNGFVRYAAMALLFLLCAAILPLLAYLWIWYAGFTLVIKWIISPLFDMGAPMRLLLVIFVFLSVAVIAGVMNTNHVGVIDVIFWPYPFIYKAVYNLLWNRFYGFGDNGEMTIVMSGIYIVCGIIMTAAVLIFNKAYQIKN